MQFAAFPATMLFSVVNKVFATFDVDGSGFLSRDKFKTAYVKFCGRYQTVFLLLHSCCVDDSNFQIVYVNLMDRRTRFT